ncbi:hypothetical protein JX265_005496 [Neoarthrinium moseri]|uniref:AMP-dependent synthetase/ligase domain-containing protein n=1 Tax=Neoarthrinium moseri TaxID=1658444 RepID=A0A9Q0AQ69_9PEZI|nr:hypothetical protein JX265_005496 [Neoarthrinium moseri]
MDLVYAFPNDFIFQSIFAVGRVKNDRVVIHDHSTGQSATVPQLLRDVGKIKQQLAQQLAAHTLQEMQNGAETWFGLLIPPGCNFVVGLLAVLALGAGVVPLSTDILPEEAVYFARTANFRTILYGSSSQGLVEDTASNYRHKHGKSINTLAIDSLDPGISLADACILDKDVYLDPSFCPDEASSGYLTFTSGTTGLPKGVVHTRKFFRTQVLLGVHDDLTELSIMPLHWAAGMIALASNITRGVRIEFCRSVYSPDWLLNRIKEPGRYRLLGAPAVWTALEQALLKHVEVSSLCDINPGGKAESELRERMQYLSAAGSGGSPVPSGVFQFFARILTGCELTDFYGSTEIGHIFAYATFKENLVHGDVCISPPIHLLVVYEPLTLYQHFLGTLPDHVAAKVSHEGELYVKSDPMFKEYLSDPGRTRAAVDDDGYFKTGDSGYLKSREFYVEGRFGFDVIRFDGWKILAREVEDELLRLPHVKECLVLPVADKLCGQRVGAIIHIPVSEDSARVGYSLPDVRSTMADNLAIYKLPTVLATTIWPLPRTASGKMAKQKAQEEFFPKGCLDGQHPELQVWDLEHGQQPRERRAWDWAGINAG